MNIFTTIRNIFRPKPADSYARNVINPPPLSEVTKPLLTTDEMAFYLSLDAKTAAQWEMGQGPIRPTLEKIDGQYYVRWHTKDVRSLAK